MQDTNNAARRLEAIAAIQKKLLGKKLSYKEIYRLMDEISHNRLSDVLTTYFVASSFKEGYTSEELYQFTKAMVETGNKIQFEGIVADKHSTGGAAGTRTTMIIVPIIAAAGFKIPKISSRAITSAAGTADVMEVVAKVDFTIHKIKSIIEKVGGCMVWNGNLGLAPADDIIIRVEEPLNFESFDKVIMSIMAKKVAVSTTHLVLDIPVGRTMKIKHFADAEKIATKFENLGKRFGIKVVADVNEALEPAGSGVGPALEVQDVLLVLEQKKNRSLKLEAKALRLAGKLLDICYKDSKIKKNGEDEARHILESGAAFKKFNEIVIAQGGRHISSESFKMKSRRIEVKSHTSGTIKGINNYNVNALAKILGAPSDKFAGIYFLKKLDEHVVKREPLLYMYSTNAYRLKEAQETLAFLPIYTFN